MAERCGFSAGSVVADLGSGTGILSELLLKNGNLVFGVEPNAEMRAAGETLLAGYPRFRERRATAEATTLADCSVDFITAGQAFHWFDRVAAGESSRVSSSRVAGSSWFGTTVGSTPRLSTRLRGAAAAFRHGLRSRSGTMILISRSFVSSSVRQRRGWMFWSLLNPWIGTRCADGCYPRRSRRSRAIPRTSRC